MKLSEVDAVTSAATVAPVDAGLPNAIVTKAELMSPTDSANLARSLKLGAWVLATGVVGLWLWHR